MLSVFFVAKRKQDLFSCGRARRARRAQRGALFKENTCSFGRRAAGNRGRAATGAALLRQTAQRDRLEKTQFPLVSLLVVPSLLKLSSFFVIFIKIYILVVTTHGGSASLPTAIVAARHGPNKHAFILRRPQLVLQAPVRLNGRGEQAPKAPPTFCKRNHIIQLGRHEASRQPGLPPPQPNQSSFQLRLGRATRQGPPLSGSFKYCGAAQ